MMDDVEWFKKKLCAAMGMTEEDYNKALASTLYYAFMRGAHAGAGVKEIDPVYSDHANTEIRTAYNDGWSAGRDAMKVLSETASKKYGYEPHVLHPEEEEDS